MPQSLVFTLLALALVLPVLGAIVLRVLAPRLSPPQLYGAATLIFGVAVASVLLLAGAKVSSLQVGDLSLLLPAVAPADQRPTTNDQRPTIALPTALASTTMPPATIAPSATSAPTEAPTEAPPTQAPTAEPPTATSLPPPPQPPGRRTYVVQPGDTLRGIAEKFNVSVEVLIKANRLTPEQADSLRVGQELVIP